MRSHVTMIHGGAHPLSLSQFMTLNGDGTGGTDFITDFSGGSNDIAYIQPPAGEAFHVTRIIVTIQDSNNTIKATTYGGLPELLNGVQLRVQNDAGTLVSLTSSEPIKYNAAWGTFNFDVEDKTWGSGDDLMLCRWTFEKAGTDIRLEGDERIEAVLQDNFTGIVHHRFLIQGNRATL